MVLNTRSDRFLFVLLVALVMMGVFLEFGGFSGSSEITGLLVDIKEGYDCQHNSECKRGLVCRGSSRVERDVTFSCGYPGGNNIQCDESADCAHGSCQNGRCAQAQQPAQQQNQQQRAAGNKQFLEERSSNAECHADLVCRGLSRSFCSDLGVSKSACDESADCGQGLTCQNGRCEITGLLVNVNQGLACQHNSECRPGLVCRGSSSVERDVTFSCGYPGGNNIQCDDPADCARTFSCSNGRCVKEQQAPAPVKEQQAPAPVKAWSRKRGETCVERDYNECEPGFSCFDGYCLLQPIKQSNNIAQNLCAPTDVEMALKLLDTHTDKTQMIIGQRLCQRVPAYKKAHPEKTDVKDCIWPKEYEETHQGVLKEYLREELHFNVTSVSSNFDANTGLVSEERFNEFMYYVRNGIPVIIHIQSHYELVIGYNDEQQVLYINDPGVGLTLKVPYVEFKNRNSNWHANREGRKNKKGWDGRYLALWANTLQESVKTNELQKHRSMSGTRCSIPNPKAIFSEVLFTYTANRQGWISTTFTLKPGESKPRSRSDKSMNVTKDGYLIWGTDGDECRIKSGRDKSILEFSKNCRLGNDDVNNHYDEFCKFCENKKGAHNDCFKNFDSWRY